MILLALAGLLYKLVMHVCSLSLWAVAFVRVSSLRLSCTRHNPELHVLPMTLVGNGSPLSVISHR